MTNLSLLKPTPMPAHLLQMLRNKKRPQPVMTTSESRAGAILEGSRNDALFRHAVALRHKGLSKQAISDSIHAINRADCNPPLGDDEVDTVIKGVLEYTPNSSTTFNPTDVGNAEGFVNSQNGEIKHCFTRKRWLIWNGKYWKEDETKEVIQRLVAWLKLMESVPINPNDDVAEIARKNSRKKHYQRTQAKARVEAAEWLARSHPECAMRGSEWNLQHHLLNLTNGTYNLATYTLQPHSKADLITNILGYGFDATAQSLEFQQFLDRIFAGDSEGTNFIVDLMGYSLLGEPREQKAFIFTGNGGNGKSTLLATLLELHGSYGVAAQPTMFAQRNTSGTRNDLARLVGKRLVSAPEINNGDKIDEMLLKQVTGGDAISARFLYAEYFDFVPQFVLIFTANNLPQVRGIDDGIWRRIVVVPFVVQIPEDTQNKGLKDALKKELSGIFNLALDGLRRYRARGLVLPESVRRATDRYRNEANNLDEFISERGIVSADRYIRCSEFHDAYAGWANARQYPALSKSDIRLLMPQKGYTIRKRHGGIESYEGIDIECI